MSTETETQNQSYFRVRLFSVPSSKEDDLTFYCMENGASGISEALAFTQPDLVYNADIVHRRSHDLDVFFATKPAQTFFDGLLEVHPGVQWEVNEEPHKDWLEEWKKGFVPFQLAGPYWVVPSWLPSPTTPEFSVNIDPGMAFGTGTHATTKMASYFVNKLGTKLGDAAAGTTLLDVGTGSGILAILARKHGIGHVTGIEIDPEARRVARENVILNGLPDIEVPETQLEEIRDSFDIVVANIIDGVLIQIKQDLLRVLKPGGQLFLTGILLEREEHFFKNFIEASHLVVHRRIEEDDWVGYWVQR